MRVFLAKFWYMIEEIMEEEVPCAGVLQLG